MKKNKVNTYIRTKLSQTINKCGLKKKTSFIMDLLFAKRKIETNNKQLDCGLFFPKI